MVDGDQVEHPLTRVEVGGADEAEGGEVLDGALGGAVVDHL